MHLASYLLSMCVRQINCDWQKLYNHQILWLETFVDTNRFKGTSYKAANWQLLGLTKGQGKDSKLKRCVSIKEMYGYPLVRDFRELLNHRQGRLRVLEALKGSFSNHHFDMIAQAARQALFEHYHRVGYFQKSNRRKRWQRKYIKQKRKSKHLRV